jgi:hypothetical protein
MGLKATRREARPPAHVSVHCPPDAALSRLLRGSMTGGFQLDRLIGALANAASPPDQAQRVVQLHAGREAPHVAHHLGRLLARARAESHPAAAALAGVAAQLGVREPAPGTAPAPRAPASPTLSRTVK